MSVSRPKRYRSVGEFLRAIGEASAKESTVVEPPQQPKPAPAPKPLPWKWLGCGVVALLVAVAVMLYPQPKSGNTATYTFNNVPFDMVDVEGGTYLMGTNDSLAFDDGKPEHRETVKSFAIGKTEVTQALWKAVMGENPSLHKGDNLPVENVSWDDCQEFITRLNNQTGKKFRLPTEAEWEYAARGGNRGKGYRYSGSDYLDGAGWYEHNSNSMPHEVASKSPNELGIYDMSGNVWEWTSDSWCDDYDSPRDNPNHVFRGGSWYDPENSCHIFARATRSDLNYRYGHLGLRLAL
jgi:formylglycine-generating enzyme required for sulfatase activity